MKAAVMTEPYQISIQDVPKPEPGSHEVLIRMQTAGICGSDVHFYDGSHPYVQYPQIFGHELAGVVAEIGSGIKQLKPGDKVIVEPAIPCGKCYACRIGKYNCCSKIDMIGGWRPGGFAEYLTAPEAYVHRMPEGMDFKSGALCEPFSIGAQMVSRANVRPGSTVTILGAGPIGLTALILLKKLHDVKAYVFDIVPERLKLASSFGADAVINPRERDPIEAVNELTDGEGSNLVMESAGLKQTMEQTIHMVSPGGRIVIVGLTNQDVSFPGILFTKKEVEIFGSRNNAGQFPMVIDFLNRHPEIADKFITQDLPFTDIANALHIAKTKPNEVNKIVLSFS